MSHIFRSLVLLVLAAVLSGCLSIGGDSKPVTLFRLNPELETPGSDQAAIPLKLSISSGSLLNSQRLWVYHQDSQVAGFAEARWAMPLPEMFRQTLINSLEQSGTAIVLESPARAPTLRVAIREFQIEAGAANADAVTSIKASWVNMEGHISHKLFRSSEPVSLDSASSVATAMDRANRQILGELQQWLLTEAVHEEQ